MRKMAINPTAFAVGFLSRKYLAAGQRPRGGSKKLKAYMPSWEMKEVESGAILSFLPQMGQKKNSGWTGELQNGQLVTSLSILRGKR